MSSSSAANVSDKLRFIADHLDSLGGVLTVPEVAEALPVDQLLALCLEQIRLNPAVAGTRVRSMNSSHLLKRLRVDATLQIMLFLDLPSLLKMSKTCWAFHRLIAKADFVWKNITEMNLPLFFSMSKFAPKPEVPKTSCVWRQLYVDRNKADVQWRKPLPSRPLVKRFIRGIHALYFDRDSLLLGSGQYNEVLSYDLKTGRQQSGASGAGMFGHSQAVTALRPLKANPELLMTSSLDTTLRLFNRTTMQLLKVYQGHTDKVWCVDVYENRVFSGSSDKTIRIWDLESTDSACEPLKSHRTSISAIKVVTNYSAPMLLTGSAGNTIRVWDIGGAEPRCVEKLRGHTKGVFCLQATPSVLMSGSLDNVIKVWDPRQGYRLVYDLRMKDENGHDIIANTDDTDTNIGVIAFQCDDTKVVSGGPDKIVRIWDLRMRAVVNSFEGHAHWITTLQFDDNKIITGSRDKTVRFWDMTGKLLDEVSPTFNDPEEALQLPPANMNVMAA